MLAQQNPGKTVVEGIPGQAPGTFRLDAGVVRVPEIEIRLPGARQWAGQAQPPNLRVGAGKKPGTLGREFLVGGRQRRSRKFVAEHSSAVRRPASDAA